MYRCVTCGESTPFEPEVTSLLVKMTREGEEPQSSLEINEVKCLYCFDCRSACFSLDEYLEGLHKSHNVKYIKKAYQQLESQSEELINQIKQMISSLNSSVSKVQHRKKETQDVIEGDKLKVRTLFDQVRAALNAKERQFNGQIQKHYEREIQELDRAMEDAIHKAETLESHVDKIYEEVLSDETDYIRAFDYYNANHPLIESYLQEVGGESFHASVSQPSITINEQFTHPLVRQIEEISLNLLNSGRDFKRSVNAIPAPISTEEVTPYTEYFRKAKEEITARGTQIDHLLKSKEIPYVEEHSSKVL